LYKKWDAIYFSFSYNKLTLSGWVAAGDMGVGDKVYLYSGEGREINELKFEYLDSPIKVYNFEVEDWHTYFVSEQDVFVHNSCGGENHHIASDVKKKWLY
jgi:hypothetical protein